jgi:redox-sensing transcriptional repressor
MNKDMISAKTIERLSIYRRILIQEQKKKREYIYSYDLAALAHRKPAQVRRDLMCLPHIANAQKGYEVVKLIQDINELLGSDLIQKMAIIGIGNMGRALLNFFKSSGKNMEIIAGFDVDKDKINRVICGCPIYSLSKLDEIIKKENITIGVITVPDSDAQQAANYFISAGIRAIINIAPVPVKCPKSVFIENIDFTTSFEKTAYYAKNHDMQIINN